MVREPPPHPPPMPSGSANRRPASILSAALAMYLTAIALTATAIGLFALHGDIAVAVEEELLGDPSFSDADWAADEIAAIVTFHSKTTAAIYLLFAVFHSTLGTLDYLGKRHARVLTLILAGVSLACCGIGGVVSRILVTKMSFMSVAYDDQISDAVLAATPGWLTALQWFSLGLLILGSMLAFALLTVPASREHFRR